MTEKAEAKKGEGTNKKQKPGYLISMEEKWVKWTGIEDPEVFEALNDFSGDLFLEMRKLTARVCEIIESKEYPDEFKNQVKDLIDETWRNIIDRQKIGLDKLCIVVKGHLKD